MASLGGSLSAAASEGEVPFAVVGDTVITAAAYEGTLQRLARQKFYHRQVPEAEMLAFQREVADAVIDRVLLLAEAKRRGMAPEHEKVAAEIATYEQRYGQNPNWPKMREAALPGLQRELAERNVLERLESAARAVEPPSELMLRKYYAAHKELFTEPQQTRLSVIVLTVDPSSPRAVWDAAREEAQAIYKRIRAGADFSELARIHSGHPSAAKGGDMGYLHQGMLSDATMAQLKELKPGQVTEPLRILEGIALFRLESVKPARLRSFEDVTERAGQLWARDESERRWKAFLASLRSATRVQIDTARYPALAEAPGRRLTE